MILASMVLREMVPLTSGFGYDWAIEQTAKCIEELVELVHPDAVRCNDLLHTARTDRHFVPTVDDHHLQARRHRWIISTIARSMSW